MAGFLALISSSRKRWNQLERAGWCDFYQLVKGAALFMQATSCRFKFTLKANATPVLARDLL